MAIKENGIAVDFNRVVSEEVEIWKELPIDNEVIVSNTGKVKNIHGRNASYHERKTTKGTYLYAALTVRTGITISMGVHRFVCLAFHGLPPVSDKKYEPNHKDGNKHNNRPDNLEWVTRSENVTHAFETGLCQMGLRVKAVNVLTKEEKNFNSLSSAARYFNTSRHYLRDIIARFRIKPYNGEWLFSVDDSSDKKLSRYQSRNIIVKDYVNNSLAIYEDGMKAGQATGVLGSVISARTYSNSVIRNKYALLSRYVFKDINDKTPWPEYSVEEALKSEEMYNLAREKGYGTECLIKCYKTGKVIKCEKITEGLRALDINLNHNQEIVVTISECLYGKLKRKSLKPSYGFSIKSLDDTRDWQ